MNDNNDKQLVNNVAVVGIGLIGGSMALALKEKNIAGKIYGVDANSSHCEKAMALGLVDEIQTMEEAIRLSDVIILAVPVNIADALLPRILQLSEGKVVMDVGSTKNAICQSAATSVNSHRFVATHPMWGTEFSGPEAAVTGAFVNKAVVICDKKNSAPDAVSLVESIYKRLGMHILFMDSVSHDVHTAYISHISHISSFALANTVLEKEKEDENIFELASGGFESTVRLAKSNIDTWVPVFKQNKENVLDVLNEHIAQLKKFKSCLEKENFEYLGELIQNANKIKRILK
ncbi:prephenate dehydrogenase [Ferruginibacter sp. HRS2-29]|nr:prephenate dehydrogenase [Ferruginibacter sp. HRS2-29]